MTYRRTALALAVLFSVAVPGALAFRRLMAPGGNNQPGPGGMVNLPYQVQDYIPIPIDPAAPVQPVNPGAIPNTLAKLRAGGDVNVSNARDTMNSRATRRIMEESPRELRRVEGGR